MTLEPLARKIAAGEGQDFDALPVDMADWRVRFLGRDRGEPFQVDYLAAAEMQRGTGLCTRWRCPVKDQCCVVRATDCLSYLKPS